MNDLAKQFSEATGIRPAMSQYMKSMDYFCVYSLLRRGYPDLAIVEYLMIKHYDEISAKSLVGMSKSIMSAMGLVEAMEDKSSGQEKTI